VSVRIRRIRNAAVAGALVASLAGLGVVAGAPAGALGNGSACRPFAVVKADVHAAATNRERTLAALVAALRARRDPWSLNAAEIATLQSASTGISQLDATVQSGCYQTVDALRADVTPLFTGYRVYWLRVPQSRGIEAADRLGEARADIGGAATKLAAHVGNNAKAKQDLDAMNAALAAADAKLGAAPSPAGSIAALAGLAPAADMTADVAAMETARADLTSAWHALVDDVVESGACAA